MGILMGNRFHHTPMFNISPGLPEPKTLLVEGLGSEAPSTVNIYIYIYV